MVKFKDGLIGSDLRVSQDIIVAIDSRAPDAVRCKNRFPRCNSPPDHVTGDQAVDRLAPVKLVVLCPLEEFCVVECLRERSAVRE
jgi:hypothetical protein